MLSKWGTDIVNIPETAHPMDEPESAALLVCPSLDSHLIIKLAENARLDACEMTDVLPRASTSYIFHFMLEPGKRAQMFS